jgi:hypothetical protein
VSAATLLDHFEAQYEALQKAGFESRLNGSGINILTGFRTNKPNVVKFYHRYVFPHRQERALCGINPGRLGAGKSGIPFVDCAYLSELLGENVGNDVERSARFFRDVVEQIGAGNFYAAIHVTNISIYGFTKGRRNLNYYELDNDIVGLILQGFAREMELMNIREIVPCSRKAHAILVDLVARGSIRAKVHPPLKHPNWCAFPSNRRLSKLGYLEVLKGLIGVDCDAGIPCAAC